MNVVECDVPSGSMLSREFIERAYFRDSYRAPLSRRELGIVDVFFGIFAHHPLWMKLLLGAQRLEPAEGPFLVGFDQARIARYIGGQDRRQPTFDPTCRSGLPRASP